MALNVLTKAGELVHVRWMIRRDYPEVTACNTFWDTEALRAELSGRNIIGMVSELHERVLGFMIYALQKRRLDLVAMAVHRSWNGKGIDDAMVETLRSKLSSHRRQSIRVIVPESDLPAQMFFKDQGFTVTHIERDYFKDEDGYRFVWRLPPSDSPQPQDR